MTGNAQLETPHEKPFHARPPVTAAYMTAHDNV